MQLLLHPASELAATDQCQCARSATCDRTPSPVVLHRRPRPAQYTSGVAARSGGPPEGDVAIRVAHARSRVGALERELLSARAELVALEREAADAAPSANSRSADTGSVSLAGVVNSASSPDEKLAEFAQRFVGREDAYATRWVSKKTGKAGWSPAVKGEFYTDSKSNADLLPLNYTVLERHLRGAGEG